MDDKMNIPELHAQVARLEKELREARDLLAQATHDSESVTAELKLTRAYALSAAKDSIEEVIEGCAGSLSRYGFCVIDDVIPPDEVGKIREEAVAASATVAQNIKAIQDLLGDRELSPEEVLREAKAKGVEMRPVRRARHPPKPPNDIIWLPKYAQHLANPVVTAVARHVLDDHLRIAQLHSRMIVADKPDGTLGGYGSPKTRGNPETREWHTDWPHDLSAYGRDNPFRNAGCIRQPFPNIAMCLVMIWYLTDVDETSGGTWAVPGSHRDKRNPRGPADCISVTAPIPGDMQVSAKAGSVFIQDSRNWHGSAMHNPSGRDRVAIVNRWAPWWLAVDDYAPGNVYSTNMVCRPLAHDEYLALPKDLQPLMRHLCPDEHDTLQEPVLERAKESGLRAQSCFQQLEEDPDSLADANAHIRVPVDRLCDSTQNL